MSNDLRGSIWKKWDLHVHPPGTKLSDGYTIKGKNILGEFCQIIEQSDVEVFGITDYFSAESYKTFINIFQRQHPTSTKKFFLNIELKLNETVNQESEEVNVHLIFNPLIYNSLSFDKIDKFLQYLKVVKTGKDETPISCSELKSESEYQSATVTRGAIYKAFKETFGQRAIRQDYFLVFTAANNEGIRPERGKRRKEIISDEIDKFSDAFFGGRQNIEFFLKVDRLEDKMQEIGKKPIVSGSDAHSFEELYKFLGKRVTETDKDNKEIIIKDVTWIKADPTYEGLKQILYEPEPQERIYIGPNEPDKKNDYQVIRKIIFPSSCDFPSEIIFNQNLCSIIGSRSSGKSALLAYIAHSIDRDLTESLREGPGEGEDFHWDKIQTNHSIEWGNGLMNNDSPGKIVYIPQNHLFNESKNPEELKRRIEPILFKHFPSFETKYKQVRNHMDICNKLIVENIKYWFSFSDIIKMFNETLRDLGDKGVVEKEKQQTESNIKILKTKYQLSDKDIGRYQEINTTISDAEIKIKQIKKDLSKIEHVADDNPYFNTLIWNLMPNLDNLPKKLQEVINIELQKSKDNLLEKTNKIVFDHKKNIEKEKNDLEKLIERIKQDNINLLEKYQKNVELEALIKKLNEFNDTLENIKNINNEINDFQKQQIECEKVIKEQIVKVHTYLVELREILDAIDQSILKDIRFDIEFGLAPYDIERIKVKVNLRDKTEFVEKNELKILYIREYPAEFMHAVYVGKQKINIGNSKEEVIKDIFTLTEKILFTAKMEGDRIGGLSETTMTPGRRALFLLKLILAESEDKWPILIDQPEDNLDSRSIAYEIVPFLKKKKKERQIIMVSHNANLVIGADSEQIIVANRNGIDRPNEDQREFNYLTGSIEYSKEKERKGIDTLKAQGTREHACLILDGGKEAFELRRNKYNLTKT